MSLEIKNLSKHYGQQKALDNISFAARPGEIIGFLGPNGAGKSTTMKIAAGFLSATHGTVQVAGHDIEDDTRSAQKKLGYLPEHNPLYLDMYVHEFLRFAGKASRMESKAVLPRVKEVVGQCGLIPEQSKKIGQLSKGYRQRVGLAHALLHDPEVLILDEPSTGLDPNQILEIRKLIKEVSIDKTTVFSTHIMQEVNALCDRVILINKGQIVADKSIDEFAKGLRNEQRLLVSFKDNIAVDLLIEQEGVDGIDSIGDCTYRLAVSDLDIARQKVLQVVSEHGLPLVSIQEEESSSLEEVFREMTKEI